MTKKERLENWRRFAKATNYLLDSEDASDEVVRAVMDFCDEILPVEHTDTYYGRRLMELGEDIARDRPRYGRDDVYEEWCQEYGSALAEILKDERTPDCVGEEALALYAKLDAIAEKEYPQRRRVAQMQLMLPELLILATYDLGDSGADFKADDQQSDAVM